MVNGLPNNTLVSLAILKTNSDNGFDIYGNFEPLLCECIKTNGNSIISTSEIKTSLLKDFGLNLPYYVIETVLTRIRNHGFIEFKKNEHCITTTQKLINSDDFLHNRQNILLEHKTIIDDLMDYFIKVYNIEVEEIYIETALLKFLNKYNFYVFNSEKTTSPIPDELLNSQELCQRDNYIISAYIEKLNVNHSPYIQFIKNITIGLLLANALYFPNPNQTIRLRNCSFYFDTTFLVYALGYAGVTRQAPCLELLDSLFENGAKICCFPHTIDEISHVLENAAEYIGLKTIKGASWVAIPNIEYFLASNETPSSIKLKIVRLQKDLASLHIGIVDKPNYEDKNSIIGEVELEEELSKTIGYRDKVGNAVKRDVASLSAIYRLRKGEPVNSIEKTQAIFITNNSRLARVSSKYLHQKYGITGIPLCITDHALTNLVWLKQTIKRPELPFNQVIADCFAARQPNPGLWKKYTEEIETLREKQDITDDDYFLLRYELSAKQILMEKTLGEEGAFIHGSVEEILEEVKARLREVDLQEKINLRAELRSLQEKDFQINQTLETNSRFLSHLIINIIKILLFICVSIYAIQSFSELLVKPVLINYLSLVLPVIFLIYSLFDYWKRIFLEICFRKIEVWLSGQFIRLQKSIFKITD